VLDFIFFIYFPLALNWLDLIWRIAAHDLYEKSEKCGSRLLRIKQMIFGNVWVIKPANRKPELYGNITRIHLSRNRCSLSAAKSDCDLGWKKIRLMIDPREEPHYCANFAGVWLYIPAAQLTSRSKLQFVYLTFKMRLFRRTKARLLNMNECAVTAGLGSDSLSATHK
jgi:hypothetical protein